MPLTTRRGHGRDGEWSGMVTGDGKSARKVLGRLKKLYPSPRHYLDFDGPFQLLVATILSAQCTDERVNATTPALFEKYPDAAAFAAAPLEDIEEAVDLVGGVGAAEAESEGAVGGFGVVAHGGEDVRGLEGAGGAGGAGAGLDALAVEE